MTQTPATVLLTLPIFLVALFGGHTPAWAKDKFHFKTKSSASMGVRGLDEESLKTAEPDPKAVESLERFVPSAAELEKFASYRGLKLRPVDSGSVLKLDANEEAKEITFGKDAAAAILGASPAVASASLQRYLNLVGGWIAARSDRPALGWHFAVLDSPSINAFAVPGGYIFLTRGLYAKLRSESELAAVLGHEITHIVARDHYNLLLINRMIQAGMAASGKLVKTLSADKEAAEKVTEQTAAIFGRALDKSAEYAADQMGMTLAADAGYEPFGLKRVLEVLALIPQGDFKNSLLFKTHPAPDERIKAIAPLEAGGTRLASLAAHPDMKDRFAEHRLKPN